MTTPALMGPGLLRIDRILVVHARGGMGDVLLATPVLDALKRRYPGADIDFLVRRGAAAMVEHHPAVHELLVVEEGELDDNAGWRKWLREVRRREYNLALVLWSTFAEAWLVYRAGIRHRVGQDSRLTYSWTFNRRVRVRSEHGDEKSHWVDCLLDYARVVNADVGVAAPRLYLDDEARRGAEQALAEAGVTGSFAVLHAGRGTSLGAPRGDEKQKFSYLPEGTTPADIPDSPGWRMPQRPFARVADTLAGEFSQVVLTGGSAEVPFIEAIAERTTRKPTVLAGRLSVPELGAVLERAVVVVANDSGPMHMAAAVGAPTVGLFMMEKDLPDRWGPCGKGNQVVRPAKFRCRPDCLKETCPRMDCYEDLDPAAVLEAARRAVSSRSGSDL